MPDDESWVRVFNSCNQAIKIIRAKGYDEPYLEEGDIANWLELNQKHGELWAAVYSRPPRKNPGELQIVCAWCGKEMGTKPGEGISGISHGICDECFAKEIGGMKYFTITSPGKTTFKVGEIISEEALNKENERVIKLGEMPAIGRVKNA